MYYVNLNYYFVHTTFRSKNLQSLSRFTPKHIHLFNFKYFLKVLHCFGDPLQIFSFFYVSTFTLKTVKIWEFPQHKAKNMQHPWQIYQKMIKITGFQDKLVKINPKIKFIGENLMISYIGFLRRHINVQNFHLMYNKKMFVTSKALTSNVKSIVSKLVFNGFSQAKTGAMNGLGTFNGISNAENSKLTINNLTQNISFGITQAKQVSEVSDEVVVENHLKKVQKTGTMVHCFNPQSHQQEDVPVRIYRTHYTVTFLPSIQFLQKQYCELKSPENVYHAQKDNTLSVYKFSCKHCNHQETRSFPENGLKYGTVITGCDQCHQVMVVSDQMGWVQPKKQKRASDLIFSIKQVHDLIKKNLKKVGIDADKEKDLD